MASTMRQKRIEANRPRAGKSQGSGSGAAIGQLYRDRLALWDLIVELRERLGDPNPYLLIGDTRDSAMMLLRDDAERLGRDVDVAALEWRTNDAQINALIGTWADEFVLRSFVYQGKTLRRPKPRYKL